MQASQIHLKNAFMYSSPSDVVKSTEHLSNRQLYEKSVMFGISGSKFLLVGPFSISLGPSVVKSRRCLGHISHLFRENKIGTVPFANCSLGTSTTRPPGWWPLPWRAGMWELGNSTANVTPSELFFRTSVSEVTRSLCVERSVWVVSEHPTSSLAVLRTALLIYVGNDLLV